jgi:GH25 family lysozyme M1 (1,4-beta-N-acetylmuramidase)
VEFETGIVPVIYTSVNGWDGQLLTPQPWASEYKLWVANYGVAEPYLPRDWSDWWLWQYGTELGAPYGVQSKHIDVNRLNDSN